MAQRQADDPVHLDHLGKPLPLDFDYRDNPVLSAKRWADNSYLIEDLAKLGYLRSDWYTLDPTYGIGTWWKRWAPLHLVTHDLALDGTDFRHMPYEDNTFRAVTYDPPYMAAGGRETTTLVEMFERFGMTGAPKTPLLLQRLINDGATEMHRVLHPSPVKNVRGGGILVVKCMDYVSSGNVWEGVYLTYRHCRETLGMRFIQAFDHIGDVRAQPARKRKDGKPVTQEHARENMSVALVFQKMKEPVPLPAV